MKTALVTGSNGQLGKSIRQISRDYPELKFIFTDLAELDITHNEEVNTFFEFNKIDYCINCAAYTAVDKAEDEADKAFLINAKALKNLAEACKNTGTVLIHVSTDFVFDGTKRIPYTEADMPNPLSVYGKSKLQGEMYIKEIWDRHFIVRTSWLYSEYGNNFVNTILRLTETRNEISVVNDQKGSPTYAKDLALFLLKIIDISSEDYGTYHYSSEGNISWHDFAVEIFKHHRRAVRVVPIPTSAHPTVAKRPAYSVMDLSKTKITFGNTIPFWKQRVI
jgi:dTDP-4-dehydrorhamnose reductase